MTEETKDKSAEDETPKGPEAQEDEAFQARLEAFLLAIAEGMQAVNEIILLKNIHLVVDLFVSLVREGLEALKKYIDNPEEDFVSWEHPWLESRYAVKWDWEKGDIISPIPDVPDVIVAALQKGEEDPVKLARSETSRQFMRDSLQASYSQMVLQALTHHVAIHAKGGKAVGHFFLVPEVKEELDALPTEEERAARMEELLTPFSIGGVEVEDESGTPCVMVPFTGPEAVGEKNTFVEAKKWWDKVSSGLLRIIFKGEVKGTAYRGSVVFVIHNLVVDEDRGEAYFPVITGLSFAPESLEEKVLSGGDGSLSAPFEVPSEPWEPASWDKESREDLWIFLLGNGLDLFQRSLRDSLPKEAEPKRISASIQCFTPKEPEEEVSELKSLEGETLRAVSGEAGIFCPPAEITPALALEAVGSPPPERLPTAGVAFGRSPISTQALSIIREAHKVRLPKKWSTLPRWNKLQEDEVHSIHEEEGDEAFKDLRKATGDKEERGPLLRHITKADGTKGMILTPEAVDRLRRRVGLGRGFIDVDRHGQERLYRLFEVGQGLLEVSLSWKGLAGPLVDEWREMLRQQAEEKVRELQKDAILFKDLAAEQKQRVDGILSQLSLWEDGRRIMEAILGQVGKQRRNPVEIPAESFRVLLWPEKAKTREWPQNWKQRVDGALTSLNTLTFNVRTYHAERKETLKGYGSMVGEYWYKPLGSGAHGDGVYIIDVQDGFMGCLNIFASGKTRLRSGKDAVLLAFDKELTKEEKASHGWARGEKAKDTFLSFDAGRPFYNAAAGLTPTQENLLHFIESNITLRRDTSRKEHKAVQVNKKAKDADKPRLYSAGRCPLLPSGQNFLGALGHFKRTPEAGFTLGGTESRPARHQGGLLFHMGHTLPAGGSAKSQRAAVISRALQDMKAVVVEYLGGTVAGHYEKGWVPLENFQDLDERTLTRRLKIFFFLPEDYEDARRQKWQETTGRRVTEDPEEAERETWSGEAMGSTTDEVVTAETGFRGWPLNIRLRAMMERRGLRQKDLAVLFGVTAPVITYWIKGTDPDEKGNVRGLPIPADVEPLIIRWVETGETPTAKELVTINARRAHKRPGKKRSL